MNKKLHYFLILVSFLCMNGMMAQGTTVSGTVTDTSTGTPIPGVTVVEKGTSNGTSTDFDGNYTITVSNGSAVLVFTSIGFTDQEIAVGGQSSINVSLAEDVELLDEVVVTALGISREKKSLGYSVTEVDGSAVSLAKEPNVVNSLAGKVAGVVVSQGTAGAGSGSRVVIRGNNSITGNNQPLYVVDGVPITTQNVGNAAEAVSNPLSDINPNVSITDNNLELAGNIAQQDVLG